MGNIKEKMFKILPVSKNMYKKNNDDLINCITKLSKTLENLNVDCTEDFYSINQELQELNKDIQETNNFLKKGYIEMKEKPKIKNLLIVILRLEKNLLKYMAI